MLRHPIFVAVLFVFALESGCERAPVDPMVPQDVNTVALRPLKLIVVDDPELAKVARREWTARAQRALELVTVDSNSLRDAITASDAALMRADAIIFPPEMLGALASGGWLQPIPGFVTDNTSFADGDLALDDDVLPLARQSYIHWGQSPYAVPMGARVFTLGYRQDVLESLGLDAPSSFAELLAAIQRFEEAPPGERWPDHALAQPLASGWAARTLLAYAAPLCHDRGRFSTLFDLRTMNPSIESPGFSRALELLIAGTGGKSQVSLNMDPTAAFTALLQGKCLFAIGWPDTNVTPRSECFDVIRVVELPGATESYIRGESKWRPNDEPLRIPLAFPSGRLGAALRNSRSQKPAWNLIVRLGGKEWGSSVCSVSAANGPVRASHLGTWLGGLPTSLGYREAISATLERRTNLPLLRIPGADQYLAALDSATHAAAKREVDPPLALAETCAVWQEITAKIGAESQIPAYFRNLGLEP